MHHFNCANRSDVFGIGTLLCGKELLLDVSNFSFSYVDCGEQFRGSSTSVSVLIIVSHKKIMCIP